MADPDFIGRGWTYPFRFSPATGGVAHDEGRGPGQQHQRVASSLRRILRTRRASVFFLRRFGSRVHELVLRTDSQNVEQRIHFALGEAIENRTYGEPRIFVQEIVVGALDRIRNTIGADVRYRLRTTNAEGNYVHPFYLSGD